MNEGRRTAATRTPDLHQLRIFTVLAEELHFGRTAARLFTTQPAVSRQVRALEDALGVAVFDRTSRAVSLTPAGRALLPEAREVLAAVDRLHAVAERHLREVAGSLRVGGIGGEATTNYAQAVLAGLAQEHPRLAVELRALGFGEQFQALLGGDVDIAFLREPVPAGIQVLPLSRERRVVCLPADDPLAAHTAVSLADLARHTVVDVPSWASRAWWEHWSADPRPDGAPVRYGPVVDDVESMLTTVARGQGIAFLPARARDFYPRPGVRYLDVPELPPSTAVLAWNGRHRDRPDIAAVRAVAARLRIRSGSGRGQG
ncbi:LysR family transcriptional regulator [Streptomyces barkulensis]|uniref:LysR family transcriptional regulator n=1 Tax=Streptomyces barkulensis TaxID=1257026 RepID=UPI000C6DD3A1|nr:LysR family transcriptional regulator [Streptomyces barkulensis]